jgi:REP element-mobilizing transposase RayT
MMIFGKESQGISQRFSHGIQHPISLCVGDKIPLPCSCRRSETSSSGAYPSIYQQHDLLIEQGHVSKDPVHILVSAPTHMSASQIMQQIKGRSSRMLQQEFPHLKKRCWDRHIWARGYFCATVGQATDQMIRDCIEGHVGESPDDSFTVDED